MSNFTFMVYGGLSPVIQSCGDHNFEKVEKNKVCSVLGEVQRNESCHVNTTIEFDSIANEFGYFCSTVYEIKNSISVQMMGVLLGAIVFGQFSDLFGRKKIMVICSLGIVIFEVLASYSGSLFIFTLLQFGTLFFAGGSNAISNVYVIENLPKKHRAWVILLISFSPNYIVVSIITYFAGDWRTLLRTLACINIIPIVLLFLAQESPRWVVQKGDLKEAREIYEKIEKYNNSFSPERKNILDFLIQKELSILDEKKKGKKYFYFHLFYTWKMIGYIGTLSFSLFCTAMITYALMFDMEQLSGSIFVNNILLGFLRYSISIVFSFMDFKIPKIGRKFIHTFSLIFVVLSMMVVFVMKILELNFPKIITVSILTCASMTAQLFTVIVVVTGELFPTAVRNIATSFLQVFARSGAIFSPHVFWLTSSIWYPAPYLFMGLLMLVNLILFEMLIPETKGNPMSDHMPPKGERIFANKNHLKKQNAA
ncbi:hypothetical protein FO519_002433 [Halicephalobus sp. NKZ332]|nr:hypothetical protein FO519_002433 [Halicephalobus sp. NKZ332]